MAIQLATVKVALALHKNNDKINILQELADKLDSDRLIDIVNINDRSKSQFEAGNIASQYGAEILVYFKTDTNVNSNITTNVRPLDSRVTAVKNWNIVSKALEVSTTTNVYYNVIELDSNTSIKETSFDVTSSTDFDFTLTKLDAKTKSEKIQLVDMEKASTLKIATIESGNDEMMLNSQLDLYEDISIQCKSPAIILTNLSDFHHTYFSKYDNIQELSKYKDLKNHVFIPFHLLEKNQGEYSTYSFIYNITYGEGNLGQILTTEVDIATYDYYLNYFNQNHL
ncbi:MAG: hypothetical protein PQJ45_02510 [Sphaerochaetaceae bacterium]|nr:hypothetical protein [Sphaerochaetaceae bacterium]